MTTTTMATTAGDAVLTEIILRWQGRVLEVRRLLGGEAITVGGGSNVDFFVPLEGGGSHELFSTTGELCLPPGVIVNDRGQGSVSLDLGLFSLELRRSPRERVAVVDRHFDAFWANVVVVVTAAMVALLAALAFSSTAVDDLDDELMQNPTRIRALVLAPTPKSKSVTPSSEPPTKTASSAKPKPKASSSSLAASQKKRASDAEVVSGKLAQLFGSADGLATVFGNADNDVLTAALGSLSSGAATASSDGALAMRTMTGAGRLTEGAGGVGEIRTRGRTEEGWGAGDGVIGDKVDHDVTIGPLDQVNITGTLDREVIRRVVRSHSDQVRYCYERALTLNPGLQGKLEIRWIIGPDGVVISADVASNGLGNADVAGCVKTRVKTWRFPAPRGGGIVAVNYPFFFKKAG